MSKEFDRVQRKPDRDRRNYKITKRCQTCKCCIMDHTGKHVISFKCKIDNRFVSLVGVCDEWSERNE